MRGCRVSLQIEDAFNRAGPNSDGKKPRSPTRRGGRGNVRRARCSQDPPSEAHRPGDRLTRECEDTRARSVNAPGPCAALLAVGFRRRSPAALSRGRAESGAFTVRFSRVIPARIVMRISDLTSRRCWLPKLASHFISSSHSVHYVICS